MAKTTYIWDELSDNVIEEYVGGSVTASYTHEPYLYGNLISQNRGGTTHYYHFDGRGDTVALTNDAGTVTDTKDYDAWGNEIASTGSTTTPYHFVGRRGYWFDSLTSTFVRARRLQLTLGRWDSMDPLMYAAGINVYDYAINSPVLLTDPSGTVIPGKTSIFRKPGDPCFRGCMLVDDPFPPPRCPECPQLVSTTSLGAYGCHCGEAKDNKPQNRPIDSVDRACVWHDKCWGKISPPCKPPKRKAKPIFPPEFEIDRTLACRVCDAVFCRDLEDTTCQDYPAGKERDTCLAYRCYAMWLFKCGEFKIPKTGSQWPFGNGGLEECIPVQGRWPPPK